MYNQPSIIENKLWQGEQISERVHFLISPALLHIILLITWLFTNI